MPYRTFFCYANSTQEAEEWIKMLQWKLVCSESYCLGIPWEQLSYKIGRVFFVPHGTNFSLAPSMCVQDIRVCLKSVSILNQSTEYIAA